MTKDQFGALRGRALTDPLAFNVLLRFVENICREINEKKKFSTLSNPSSAYVQVDQINLMADALDMVYDRMDLRTLNITGTSLIFNACEETKAPGSYLLGAAKFGLTKDSFYSQDALLKAARYEVNVERLVRLAEALGKNPKYSRDVHYIMRVVRASPFGFDKEHKLKPSANLS